MSFLGTSTPFTLRCQEIPPSYDSYPATKRQSGKSVIYEEPPTNSYRLLAGMGTLSLNPSVGCFTLILLGVVALLVPLGYSLPDQESVLEFSAAGTAAIHPALGRNSSLKLEGLRLAVKIFEPGMAEVNVSYRILNPTDRAVTEVLLLPVSASLGISSVRSLLCWLYAEMPLQFNTSYLRLNITQDHQPVAFTQLQEDPSLNELLMRYPGYNLTQRVFRGKGPFLPFAFNLTVRGRSSTSLSTSYFVPYSLYPYPVSSPNWRANVTSVQGFFSFIGASAALWTETARLELRVTIDSSLFHGSNLSFSHQDGSYIHFLQMSDWHPAAEPVFPVTWTAWQGRPDELPSILVEYLDSTMPNQTALLENPWESHVPEDIKLAGYQARRDGSKITIEAHIRGAEDACLIPMLEYQFASRYAGAGGGMPPTKRDGGKYQWELDRLPEETGTLIYQVVVYNNDIWTASPIQFLRLPELGWWNATIAATMWMVKKSDANGMPLLVFRLPENISDPRCEVIYLARGIPGASTGSMQRIDDGIFTYQCPGSDLEFIGERLDRGVGFAYVTSRDEGGALTRSEVFMFTFGGGVSLDLEADYSQPSPGPVPIRECVLGLPILLGCGLLLTRRRRIA